MRYLLVICLLAGSLFVSFTPFSEYTIRGKVSDDTGQPLAGVSVAVKGSSIATVTLSDGSFTIKVPSEKVTLVFSYVGFQLKEVKVTKDKPVISVTLRVAVNRLEEVVVTGTERKSKDEFLGLPSTKGADPSHSRRQYDDASRNNNGNGQVQKHAPGHHNNNNWRYNNDFNREGYDGIVENRFLKVADNPLSTFSIDVDAASYSNVRRMLSNGQMPPAGAVRIEEMINYFKYCYPQPKGEDPFSINTEIADCPWNNKHKLVLIGLQGKQIETENLPPSNLVFLVDVSGSMNDPKKLPLVKQSMKLLADQIRSQDRVAIVVYAGNAGLVLPSTSGQEKESIKDAIDRLEAGGSTAGGAGIRLAYKVATKSFIKGGNNRVILCTDGDFNVGESSDDAMERLIEEERKSGVFLTVLGYGTGNYQDAKMQKLADKGNGNHAYIDDFSEARKVLVSEFGGTLFTIAKDVKLQLEFNPAKVQAYRLIGYENRLLNKEDFNNDKKDAGDLGSGHTVTALYEVIPVGVKSEFTESVDPLKYQQQKQASGSATNEILTVKFRYKQPDGDKSKLIEHAVRDQSLALQKTTDNFRFAAAVAEFGMLLRNSEFKQAATYDNVWKLARNAMGDDKEGYRGEFLKLVRNAELLAGGQNPNGDDVSSKYK